MATRLTKHEKEIAEARSLLKDAEDTLEAIRTQYVWHYRHNVDLDGALNRLSFWNNRVTELTVALDLLVNPEVEF